MMKWLKNFFHDEHKDWLHREVVRLLNCLNQAEDRHSLELVHIREGHLLEIARLEGHHLDGQVAAMQRYEDMKKSYDRELIHVIEESHRLRDDLERLRLYLTPTLQNVQLHREKDESGPPTVSELNPQGTPWDRLKARYIREQEEAARAKHTVPAAQGESDGSDSTGRVDAPLSGASQPA